MAADNWAKCPYCHKAALEDIKARQKDLNESYGVVSIEVFEAKRERLAKDVLVAESITRRTWRESYAISGAEDGVVVVEYLGSCDECKKSFEFSARHPLPGFEE